MSRRLSVIALLLLLPTLSACGFRPLYGPPAQAGQPALGDVLAQLEIDMIADRIGQLTRNTLLERLQPRGQQPPLRYRLTVSLSEEERGLALRRDQEATLRNYTLRAAYRLTSLDGQTIVAAGNLSSTSSYNKVSSDFATLTRREASQRNAARDLATRIATRVAAALRRGTGQP